jgi:error-prone DNA polymerase
MGFYSIATIVEDAKRQGVEVWPLDVCSSDWHCSLEPASHDAQVQPFGVRMGMRFVKGLAESAGQSIVAARAAMPFSSLTDFTRRTGLEERCLSALAKAGAFEALEATRRSALWDVARLAGDATLPLPLDVREDSPVFPALDSFETITWDYRAASHSARGHPLAPLRPALRAQGLPTAQEIAKMNNDRRTRYAGIVICRQRPGTASGVVFMTLEDETGFVNVVVWSRVFAEYELLAKTAGFLGLTGKIQSQDDVVHLVAEELWTPRVEIQPERTHSRDFH